MMKYFEYKRYKYRLKFYKIIAAALIVGLLLIYVKLSQMGFTAKQMTYFVYAFCIAAILICVGIKLGVMAIKKKKYLDSPLASVDKMSGKEFEYYLKCHFEKLGYRVKLTPDSGDYGADLVCKNSEGTLIIQAKRYYNQRVGISAIQEIAAAKAYYKADKCMVVTNSFFTNAAKELARANNVELCDRTNINKLLIKAENIEDKNGTE